MIAVNRLLRGSAAGRSEWHEFGLLIRRNVMNDWGERKKYDQFLLPQNAMSHLLSRLRVPEWNSPTPAHSRH